MPTSEKQLFCHLHKKASCKYVDNIDARLQIDKVGQLNMELLEEGGEITLLGQPETVKKLQFEEDS